MTIDRHKLRGAYARLRGMQQAVLGSHGCPGTLGRDFNGVVEELGQTLGEAMDSFELPHYAFYGSGSRDFCRPQSSPGYRPPAPETILPPASVLACALLQPAQTLANARRILT